MSFGVGFEVRIDLPRGANVRGPRKAGGADEDDADERKGEERKRILKAMTL